MAPSSWSSFYRHLSNVDPSFRSTSRQSALHTPSLKTKTPLDLSTVLSGKHYALLLPDGTKDGLHIVHEVRSVCKDGDPSNLGFLGVYGNSQVAPVVKINLTSSNIPMLLAAEERKTCPSWDDFLTVEEEDEFGRLRASTKAKNIAESELPDTINFGHLFFISHSTLSQLNPPFKQKVKASEIALLWIKTLQDEEPDEDCSPSGENEPILRLLQFLWMVAANPAGKVVGIDIQPRPDDPDYDRVAEGITSLVQDNPKSAPASSANTFDFEAAIDAISRAHAAGASSVQGPNAGSALQAAVANMLADKTSKTLWGRFNDDQKQIWKNCCSIAWRDSNPALTPTPMEFLSKKSTIAANNYLAPKFKKVAPKADLTNCAITELITSGFLSIDEINPGGLTPFFIKIRSDLDTGRLSTQHRKRAVKQLEEQEISDSEYMEYTTTDYFIPRNADQLETVLEGFHALTQLLTHDESIIAYPLEDLVAAVRRHRVNILNGFRSAPDYGARLLFRLDNGYNEFFQNIAEFEAPVDAAKEHRHDLPDLINDIIKGIRSNSPPNVSLPETITSRISPTSHHRNTPAKPPERAPPAKRARISPLNASPVAAWQIPPGKEFSTYFSRRSQNTKGWPLVPHHRTGKPSELCVRFQLCIPCSENCERSHINSGDLPPDVTKACHKRFSEIYS